MATTVTRKYQLSMKSKPTPRGRPPKRVYINVLVRETTRSTMKVLTKRHDLTQGELLDQIFSGKLSV